MALLTNADGGMEGCATENKISPQQNEYKLTVTGVSIGVRVHVRYMCPQLQIHHTCTYIHVYARHTYTPCDVGMSGI